MPALQESVQATNPERGDLTFTSDGSEPPCVIHLLMATCEGRSFIAEQLDSLAEQSHRAWTLTVSDDGSKDDTLERVAAFAKRVSQPVRVMSGPEQGATQNFVHLVHGVNWQDPDTAFLPKNTDLFAFVDQDDVWLPHKLARAVRWHQEERRLDPRGLTAPLLYASATQEVDAFLRPQRVKSERLAQPELKLGFGGALTQNVIRGNTMVMNAPLISIYQAIAPHHCVWHDWTAYLVATACGGLVHVDPEVSVLYRQHADNVIGSQRGLLAQWTRLRHIPSLRYRAWMDTNLAATEDMAPYLTPASRALRDRFQQIRALKSPIERIRQGFKCGLWRQSPGEQAAFLLGLGLGWV